MTTEQAQETLLAAVLRLLQEDPHMWSARPCKTCKAVSAIADRPFGCYEYQRRVAAGEPKYRVG